MTNPMEPAFGYSKDSFNQTCDYCGCVFRVDVPGQKGHEESEEYYCPRRQCSASLEAVAYRHLHNDS